MDDESANISFWVERKELKGQVSAHLEAAQQAQVRVDRAVSRADRLAGIREQDKVEAEKRLAELATSSAASEFLRGKKAGIAECQTRLTDVEEELSRLRDFAEAQKKAYDRERQRRHRTARPIQREEAFSLVQELLERPDGVRDHDGVWHRLVSSLSMYKYNIAPTQAPLATAAVVHAIFGASLDVRKIPHESTALRMLTRAASSLRVMQDARFATCDEDGRTGSLSACRCDPVKRCSTSWRFSLSHWHRHEGGARRRTAAEWNCCRSASCVEATASALQGGAFRHCCFHDGCLPS